MSSELIAQPVELKPDEHSRIQVMPMYHTLGLSDEPRVFMQREAKKRLVTAVERLPERYGVVVWDAYRSREVQATMFDWMKEQVKKKNPSLTPDEIYQEARKYMSPPSAMGDEYVPPHLSGGAIDLTLMDVSSGRGLLLGTPFDDCTERAHALFFEKEIEWSSDDIVVRCQRRVLREAMVHAGFTVYQYEWWHFDYGNVFWSAVTGRPPIFGPLFGNANGPMMI